MLLAWEMLSPHSSDQERHMAVAEHTKKSRQGGFSVCPEGRLSLPPSLPPLLLFSFLLIQSLSTACCPEAPFFTLLPAVPYLKAGWWARGAVGGRGGQSRVARGAVRGSGQGGELGQIVFYLRGINRSFPVSIRQQSPLFSSRRSQISSLFLCLSLYPSLPPARSVRAI